MVYCRIYRQKISFTVRSLSSSLSWTLPVIRSVLVGVTMLFCIKGKQTKCWAISPLIGRFCSFKSRCPLAFIGTNGPLAGGEDIFYSNAALLRGFLKLLGEWSHNLRKDGTGLSETWQDKQTERRTELHAGWWWSCGENQHDYQLHLQWIQQRVQTNSFWRFHWWVKVLL